MSLDTAPFLITITLNSCGQIERSVSNFLDWVFDERSGLDNNMLNTYLTACKSYVFGVLASRSTKAKNIFVWKSIYKKSTLRARDRICAILFDFITLLQSRGYIAQVQSRVLQSRFFIYSFLSKDIFCICSSWRAEPKSVFVTTSLVSVKGGSPDEQVFDKKKFFQKSIFRLT